MAKIKLCLQSEASECGLACLAMVGGAHGLGADLRSLRQRFAVSLKGITLKQLIEHASALGFNSRPLRLDLADLRQLTLPCILHWDLQHFVVLSKVSRGHVTILDPAVGERRLSLPEVSDHFTGVALELTPRADFQPPAVVPRMPLRMLTGKVRGLKQSLLQIFLVAVTLELFALVAPLFNQLVVDEVLSSGDRHLLTVLALGFGLLLLIQTAIGLVRSWMVMVLGQTVSLQWASNVFSHLVRLPLAFFEQRHLGDVVSRFNSIQAIQRILTTAVVEAVLDGLMAVTAVVMMWLYAPALCAITMLAVASYALLRWVSYRPFRDASAEQLVVAAKENTYFLETLRAITPLKLFGREDDRCARWQNLRVDVQNREVRTARMGILFNSTRTLIFGLENLLVVWVGARMILDAPHGAGAPFTVGMLFAFISYKTQFSDRTAAFINYMVDLKMLGLHAERLSDITLTKPERSRPQAAHAQAPEMVSLAHLSPSLGLRNVSFRYAEGEPWLLRHANFTVEAGQNVAVIGPSGGGKTTLLKIMLGLLSPTEGEVLFGGVPLHQLGLSNVRRRLGTVMQDDVLLTGSIGDNISFFDERYDPERIESCAKLAQVHEEIVAMPMGYQTLVGDLGAGLSGGQRQRLLLARALYKKPRVLALDEATSHLDVGNERAVTAALSRLPLTRLIIAHRPETIAGAQRVVQLRDGQVIEVVRSMVAGPGVAGAHG